MNQCDGFETSFDVSRDSHTAPDMMCEHQRSALYRYSNKLTYENEHDGLIGGFMSG